MKKVILLSLLVLGSIIININIHAVPTGKYQLSCKPGSCSIQGEILTCTNCGTEFRTGSALNYTKCSTGRVEIGERPVEIGEHVERGKSGVLVCTDATGHIPMITETMEAYAGVTQP